MSTVNYSIPDDVKALFNETFADRNRSALIAGLMLRAVEEHRAGQQQADAIDRLLARRGHRAPIPADLVREARDDARP